MRKIIYNLKEKISLEMIILIISILLITSGFVYASWQTARTTTNPGQTDVTKVEQNNWNGLVGLLNDSGHCTAATVVAATVPANSLTQTNWNSLGDLFSQALADSFCTCQHLPCSNDWTDTQSSGNLFTKSVWNALVDHIYGKCNNTIANCLTQATAAKISGAKLTVTNWNNLVDLANTTLTNCVPMAGCTPNCSTGPGCRSSLSNGHTVAGTCCGGTSCYDCDAGTSWDGSACVAAGGCTGGYSYLGVCWRIGAAGANCNTTCSAFGSCQSIPVTVAESNAIITALWGTPPANIWEQPSATIFGFNCMGYVPATNAQYQTGGYSNYPCSMNGCPGCGVPENCYLNACPCAN